jgi:hypothetical protein
MRVYYWLLPVEGHLMRRRFGAMLGRIALPPVPTGDRAGGQVGGEVCLQ